MRRFSQRNSLVTLNDINITPLLDLAFVLLIIFVIISPSIRSAHEQSIKLNLPKGGQAERKFDKSDIMVAEVSPEGFYVLSGRRLALPDLKAQILSAAQANPNLVVWLRADENSPYKLPAAVLSFCQDSGIACSLKTEAERP